MKKWAILFSGLAVLWLLLPSCGEESAEDQLDRALYLMERNMYRMLHCDEKDPFECKAYFSEANDLFKETIKATTDSQRLRTAYVGAAITEILKLNEDNELKNIKTRFQNYLDTATLFQKSAGNGQKKISKHRRENLLDFRLSPWSGALTLSHQKNAERLMPLMKAALGNPPLMSEVQSVIRRKVIPALNYAMECLTFVQNDPDYYFKVTPRMQGSTDADTLEMDMTEIKALHAGLMSLRATFRIFNAYNLDVTNYSIQSIANALNKPSHFLKLYSNHELAAARTDLMTAADTLIAAIRFLRSETDDQNNDIIKIDTLNHPSPDDLEEIENMLNDMRQGLISNVTIHDINDYGDSVVVSSKNFFTNPIQDFKEKLPDYVVLVHQTECGTYLRWKFKSKDFPDPTFNGIFPYLTSSNEFKRIFDIHIDTVGITSMSATINGVNWTACETWGESCDGHIWISGERNIENNSTEIDDHISIDLYGITGPGTYLLGGNSSNVAHYCLRTPASYNRWETGAFHTGTITITEMNEDFIRGTFSFTGYSNSNGSTRNFTNGTFYVDNTYDCDRWRRQKQNKLDHIRIEKQKK